MLHTGDEPQKMDTGELEPILPDWLQDARQQNRTAAEEEATRISATRPKVQKNEPLDLLAGLASQGDSDDEDVPDWLASLNPAAKQPPAAPPASKQESASDFFAQFSQKESQPSKPPVVEPEAEQTPAWMQDVKPAPEQNDELGGWFAQTSGETSASSLEPVADDNAWMNNLGVFSEPQQEAPAEKQPEDLSWLHNLESTAKQTDELSFPQSAGSFDFGSQPASAQDDLGWLNNLGGTPAPSFEEPKQPASSQEDLSWLNTLGGTPASSFEEPKQPASSQEDLSWLNNLGGTSTPSFEESKQPASSQEDLGWLNTLGGTPAPSSEEPEQPASSQEDLNWLNALGGTPASSFEEPKQPASSQQDLSWLSNLGGAEQPSAPETTAPAFADETDWMKNLGGQEDAVETAHPQYTPRGTAPLSQDALQDTTPDWLKSAMAEPSMPAPGDLSMDWFADHSKQADVKPTSQTFDETSTSFSEPEPASASIGFDLPFSDSSHAASQDVDSLFNVEMPDWLSQQPQQTEGSQPQSKFAPAIGAESLSPVELPSWVQAMRPVDSAIEDLSASDVDQVTEREGPLAGFRGIIPFAPIGSSLRPKALSLKLQVTEEQQTGAGLIEKIINSETLAHPSKTETLIAPQRILRWILTGLFIALLGFVIGSGMRIMSISASATVNEFSNMVMALPENSQTLVVVDYEPSLAGELEATAGPVLEQFALSRHSVFTFVSMSPNGSGLVERLMTNTKLRGLGYQAGAQYFNPGFLAGGSAGILGFIENPHIMPAMQVDAFSNFDAVILMTDNSESARVWVEQLEYAKSRDPLIASKPLFVVSSAQAGPMMQPYLSSGQVDIMVSGLSSAVQYEYVNNTQLRTARSYWDAFGVGLALTVVSIVLGSLWNLFMGIRERRAESEQE